jgi:hypothetical protein
MSRRHFSVKMRVRGEASVGKMWKLSSLVKVGFTVNQLSFDPEA